MKLIIILFLISMPILAEDFKFDAKSGKAVPTFIGQIKHFKGEVFKKNKNAVREVKAGTRFSEQDSILTKNHSLAKILMVDDTLLSIGPNTEFKFAEFKFLNKTDRKSIYEIIKGQVRGSIRNKAKEGDIIFKTSLTTMGVRGTEILANHHALQDLEISEFSLLSGSAQLIDNQGVKHDLQKYARVVVIKNNKANKSGSDRFDLDEDNFSYLMASEKNENTEFKPFLPFFDIALISPSSSLHPIISQTPADNQLLKNPSPTEASQDEKKSWRQNLDKLNDKLRNYQKSP